MNIIIKSKVYTCVTWNIDYQKNNELLSEDDYDFIANYNPTIYNNDLTGKEWCFDTKLPSGKWLECIHPEYRNGTVFKALIL